MAVDVHDVSVDLAGRRIVEAATLHVREGGLVALVGPNGSGKTTLVRAVHRALRPRSGRVEVGGEDVWEMTARASARRTAVVVQRDLPDFEFTVRETVGLGRVPHRGLLDRAPASHVGVVDEALATAGVAHLAGRLTSTLSGGERQRVAVARALAQQTPVVVLDEPTNHLDVRAQIELLDLLTTIPSTVLTVLHDLNLAAAYAEHLFVLDAGRIVADGPPSQVLTPELVARVYGVAAHCTTNPLTGRPSLQLGPLHPHPPSEGRTP